MWGQAKMSPLCWLNGNSGPHYVTRRITQFHLIAHGVLARDEVFSLLCTVPNTCCLATVCNAIMKRGGGDGGPSLFTSTGFEDGCRGDRLQICLPMKAVQWRADTLAAFTPPAGIGPRGPNNQPLCLAHTSGLQPTRAPISHCTRVCSSPRHRIQMLATKTRQMSLDEVVV